MIVKFEDEKMKKKYIILILLTNFALQNNISSMVSNGLEKDSYVNKAKTSQMAKILNKHNIDMKDWKKIIDLINGGADINTKSNDGNTALIRAVINHDIGMIKFLISKKANVNSENNDGKTALLLAVYYRYKDVIGLLLDAGADINAKDSINEDTPLRLAVLLSETGANYRDIISFLISKGASVNIKDEYGLDILTWAKMTNASKDILDLLHGSNKKSNNK